MKKIIVALAFAAVSALLTGCWVEKVADGVEKVGDGVEKVGVGMEKVGIGMVEVGIGMAEVIIGVVEVVRGFFFTANLSELGKRSDGYGDVYYVKKTLEPYSGDFIDTSGNVIIKGTLKNGRRHGKIKTYRKNGSIEKIETFEDNVLNGEWKNYYENGNPRYTGHYKYGKPDGKWKRYYENYDKNGKLMPIEKYKDREPHEKVEPICVENYRNGKLGSFTDPMDGKAYATVEIGSQIWMAENLNYVAEGSVCYDNNAENCTKYGRLYDWNTAKNACPDGWHLPSEENWEEMTAYTGGGDTEGKKLKAKSDWNNRSDGSSGNGTDEFGFSALPGGGKYSFESNFVDIGDIGYWWSASEYNSDKAVLYAIHYNFEDVRWYHDYKSNLSSVRCVKN